MDHLLASPLGIYQPYLIHTLSIKVSTRFHQLSKTKLGLSDGASQDWWMGRVGVGGRGVTTKFRPITSGS
jgi:hypothetical protein